MQLATTKKTTERFLPPNVTDLNFEFYSQLNRLTKNITPAQLEILHQHVENISPDDTPSPNNIHLYPGKQSKSNTTSANKTLLSKRETEVLILVTNGYSRRDIGSSLGISKNTAARHIANIYQKLEISCVAEATHYALANNIVAKSQ